MYQRGAVISKNANDDLPLSDADKDDAASRLVYTDSVFWFDAATRNILLSLYDELAPLDVEIDAYGDFLQALGMSRVIRV